MRRTWRVGAWLLLGTGLLAAVVAAVMPVIPSAVERRTTHNAPPASPSRDSYPADSLAQAVVSRNVFRTTRRPAPVAYDANALSGPVGEPPMPKPMLALVGIVEGDAPTAVIEGFPGVDGPRVVRIGETVAGLRVTRIARAEVRIAGLDTVWVLRVREPWR